MPSALIIGGGPAGSMAGLLLARTGFVVTLLEQHTFPRDKVCGECLSALGIDVLGRAGIDSIVRFLDPVLLTRTLLHPLVGPSIDVPLPRVMWGLSRRAMDQILLDAAVTAGVTLYQPARCERLIVGQGQRVSAPIEAEDKLVPPRSDRGSAALPLVQWRDLTSNVTSQTIADWIIVADGKGSLLGRSPAASGDLGIKTHFERINGPRDAIELFAGHGHYGGLAPIEANRWNAAFSIPAARVRDHSGNLEQLFDQIISEIPMLSDRTLGAKRVSPWLASPLPRFPIAALWPDRVIPLGNAAAALEPVGGEGMGLALRSAEMAVEAIVSAERVGNLDAVWRLPVEFNRLWQTRRLVCRGIARLFSNQALTDAVAPLIADNVGIAANIMHWAGKY